MLTANFLSDCTPWIWLLMIFQPGLKVTALVDDQVSHTGNVIAATSIVAGSPDDTDAWGNNRSFVTSPRFDQGVLAEDSRGLPMPWIQSNITDTCSPVNRAHKWQGLGAVPRLVVKFLCPLAPPFSAARTMICLLQALEYI